MSDNVMTLLGYQRDSNKPTIYIRKEGEVHNNMYLTDSHPNDQSNRYKAGQSKGRMKGLEDVGWVGYSKIELHDGVCHIKITYHN